MSDETNFKVFEWLAGFASASILGVAGWVLGLGNRMTRLESQVETHQKSSDKRSPVVYENQRRIDRLESSVQSIDRKLDENRDEFKEGVERILERLARK